MGLWAGIVVDSTPGQQPLVLFGKAWAGIATGVPLTLCSRQPNIRVKDFLMKFVCPHCKREMDSANLRTEWGPNGGTKCPECGGVLRPYLPHKRAVAVVSALSAILVMKIIGVRSWAVFGLGVALLWVPFSLILNTLSRWKKPLRFEAAPPRRSEADPFIRFDTWRR